MDINPAALLDANKILNSVKIRPYGYSDKDLIQDNRGWFYFEGLTKVYVK